ncbi:MAG: hypothetical protein K2X61_06480 [Caulobacteraceae bacterium]|nr:hypothetical protein [Caulobacteraceae bacterium]
MKTFSTQALEVLESGEAIVSGSVRFGLAEPVRLWGGHGSLSLGGETYVGVGDQGTVEVSGGTLGGMAEGAMLTLSGVDPDVAAQVDFRALRGASVVLQWLVFDGGGRVLLDAQVWLRGRADSVSLDETPGGTSTLKVGVEGAARALGRRSERMRSDADQRLIDEADAGFRRVAYAGRKSVYWGGKPPERAVSAFGGGMGGGGGFGDLTVRPIQVF